MCRPAQLAALALPAPLRPLDGAEDVVGRDAGRAALRPCRAQSPLDHRRLAAVQRILEPEHARCLLPALGPLAGLPHLVVLSEEPYRRAERVGGCLANCHLPALPLDALLGEDVRTASALKVQRGRKCAGLRQRQGAADPWLARWVTGIEDAERDLGARAAGTPEAQGKTLRAAFWISRCRPCAPASWSSRRAAPAFILTMPPAVSITLAMRASGKPALKCPPRFPGVDQGWTFCLFP